MNGCCWVIIGTIVSVFAFLVIAFGKGWIKLEDFPTGETEYKEDKKND